MEKYKYNSHSNRIWSGLILLIVGLVFLLRNFGLDIPYWVFSWSTLLILIGLIIGFKRNFHGGGWLIMVLAGTYFTLQNVVDVDLSQYYFAAGFIILGLFLILKPKSRYENRFKCHPFDTVQGADPAGETAEGATENGEKTTDPAGQHYNYGGWTRGHKYSGWTREDENDYIDSVNVFGGSKQQVYSKNFKGGDVISIFGGCDLDLTQADFQNGVTIEIVAIFGGVKLIIPSTWIVKSQVSPIFGGLDDKRVVNPVNVEPLKIITIKGVALFGGVSISNY